MAKIGSKEVFLIQVDELGKKRVWAIMRDGRRFEGDVLMGADGIRSKVVFSPRCSSDLLACLAENVSVAYTVTENY